MILDAACPVHGRDSLANAGAPYIVRCFDCGTVYERCPCCHGTGWMAIFSVLPGGDDEAAPCVACNRTGWVARKSTFGHCYPVS